jgi:hypothetical protein
VALIAEGRLVRIASTREVLGAERQL